METKIDAGAVQRITGVQVPTLNVWISRGLIPGASPAAQGKARLFDLDAVFHIAVMAAIVRLGLVAPIASMAAAVAKGGYDRPGAKIILGPPRSGAYGLTGTPTIDYIEAETSEELDAFLDGFADDRPEAYTLVELDRLTARVRKAFHEPDLAERARRERGIPARRSVRNAQVDG